MISGRKDCMSGEQKCQPHVEAEALYCQGSHAKKTRIELAEAMDVNPSTLGNWLDPHHSSRIPDDRREQLLRLTADHDAYVRYLASLQGFVVYDPKLARGTATRMVSEFSDVLKIFDQALADGKVTLEEARQLEREADDLHAAVDASVREVLRQAGVPGVEARA